MSECEPQYTVKYFGGSRPLDQPPNIQYLSWQRKLDDISDSTVRYIVSNDDCCQFLQKLEPLRDSYGIYRDNKLAWFGWIQDVEYSRGMVEVQAKDGLSWLTKRVIHSDLKFTNMDESLIFEGLYHSAMDISPVDLILDIRQSGVKQSRIVKEAGYRIVWNIVREMLDAGLDVTAYGKTIVVGPITRPAIELLLSDVRGGASLTKEGNLYNNRVIANVASDVTGIYPPGPAKGVDSYPLVETVITDSEIPDAQSALNTAKSRYDFSRIVPRIVKTQDGIVLQPNTNLKLQNLIAGQLINLQTTGICYDTKESFRLGQLDVEMTGGVETIRMSLQPVGTLGTLDSGEDAGF